MRGIKNIDNTIFNSISLKSKSKAIVKNSDKFNIKI